MVIWITSHWIRVALRPSDTLRDRVYLTRHLFNSYCGISGGLGGGMRSTECHSMVLRQANECWSDPCELVFCPFWGQCVILPSSSSGVECRCRANCSSTFAPVCGTDNVTHNNDCLMQVSRRTLLCLRPDRAECGSVAEWLGRWTCDQ